MRHTAFPEIGGHITLLGVSLLGGACRCELPGEARSTRPDKTGQWVDPLRMRGQRISDKHHNVSNMDSLEFCTAAANSE